MKRFLHSVVTAALTFLAPAATIAAPGPSGILGRPDILEPKSAVIASPAFYVDAARGDDKNDGSQAKPWRTVQHSVRQLRPGHTLYLRGGTYFENVYCSVLG